MFIQNAYATTTTTPGDIIPNPPEQPGSSWMSMLPLVMIVVVFYFFLIRPQEKKRKEQEELVKSVKKGEEVVTLSGIYGTVKKVNDTDATVELEIADKVSIKVLKSSIADVVSRKAAK